MSLFLFFFFFNTVNHFIPSTFWNNSPESIDSAEHLLVRENHGCSSTGSFHSLWSLKALQSHFPINLGAMYQEKLSLQVSVAWIAWSPSPLLPDA